MMKIKKFLILVFIFIFSASILPNNLIAFSDGTEDTDFSTNLGNGFDSSVFSIALQSDQDILVGGEFFTFNGNTRNYLVRLNSDGTEDTTFYTNLGLGFTSAINSIAVQTDGRILVGGEFSTFNGNTRNYLVRLNSDGTEDLSFNLGDGFNGPVKSIKLQTDGKILVGGKFNNFDGNERNNLVRLNSNGTEDTAFYTNLGDGFDSQVFSIAVQSDGYILVGGSFTIFNHETRNHIVRLKDDGSEHTSFYDNLGGAFDNIINSFFIQPDGDILIGGSFTEFNGNTRNYLVRLNSDGTEDTDFYTNLGSGFNAGIGSIQIQSDGDILIGGSFTEFNENSRNRLVRLNSDGTEDTDFYTNLESGFSGPIGSIVIDNNDDILVGGSFSSFNENTTAYLVRLTSDNIAPTISEVTPISTPNNDNTPTYTFTTDEAGDITYGGSCTSETTEATEGENTITFNELEDGTYDDCTITVTDSADNDSNILTITSFTIDATSPILSEVTPIGSTTNQTPEYTFNTDEEGDITYGGSCVSTTTTAVEGNNTITFNELELGTYDDCTITITDEADNTSNTLDISTFTIKRKPSSGSYVSFTRLTTPTVTTPTPTLPSNTLPTTPTNTENNNENNNIENNTCQPFTSYLKKGNRNNNKQEVMKWQAFLNQNENEKLTVDGIFGNNTENAVKRFQTKYKEHILTPLKLNNATGYIYRSTISYGNRLLDC